MKHYVVTRILTYNFQAKSLKAAKKAFANMEEGSDFDYEVEESIVEQETGNEEKI